MDEEDDFRVLCLRGDFERIFKALYAGDGYLSVLMEIDSNDIIRYACQQKRDHILGYLLEAIFDQICETGRVDLLETLLDALPKDECVISILSGMIRASRFNRIDILEHLFVPRFLHIVELNQEYIEIEDYVPFVKVVPLATMGYMFASHPVHLVVKYISAAISTDRFAELMPFLKPRILAEPGEHYGFKNGYGHRFIKYAFEHSPTNIIESAEFRDFVANTFPAENINLHDAEYLYIAAGREDPFLLQDLGPGPYALTYETDAPDFDDGSISTIGSIARRPKDVTFTRTKHLISAVTRLDTALHLVEKLSEKVVFGDPVDNLAEILLKSDDMDDDLIAWIVRHPLMQKQVTRDHFSNYSFDGVLAKYRVQQIMARLESEIMPVMHGLDDPSLQWCSNHEKFGDAVFRSITHCITLRSHDVLRRLVQSIGGMEDLGEDRAVRMLVVIVTGATAEILETWLEIPVPVTWLSYAERVFDAFVRNRPKLTARRFSRFCYVNRDYIQEWGRRCKVIVADPQYYSTANLHILHSYGISLDEGDTMMEHALAAHREERVASLLFCGHMIPADYVLAESDRDTLIGTMVTQYRLGWSDRVNHLIGGSRMRHIARAIYTVNGVEKRVMPYVPFEICNHILGFMRPGSFKPDSGPAALNVDVIDELIISWTSF